MTHVLINPGTGPLANTKAADARRSIEKFVADLGLTDVTITEKGDDGTGRFTFVLSRKPGLRITPRTTEIDMPGLPPERVRFLGAPDQNIWHFPRLYVDGSSWVWKYAIGFAYAELAGKKGETEDDEGEHADSDKLCAALLAGKTVHEVWKDSLE